MATNRWLGTAANIAQVDTITIASTWATGDTVSANINGNSVTVTVGSTATTAEVASALSAAINASDKTTGLVGDETRNVGGQQIPEFTEVTASVSGSVVTVTGNTPGKPFTMTASAVTAGSGTATRAASVAATGANHWSDAGNWSEGAVPANGDDIYIDGSVSILYGLPQGSLEPASVTVFQSFTGKIGLAERNTDNAAQTYAEYRDQYLYFDDDNGGDTATLVIGQGSGAGSSRIKIRWVESLATATIYATGTPPTTDEAAVKLYLSGSTNEADVHVLTGRVSIGELPASSQSVDSLTVGLQGGSASAAQVFCGPGISLVGETLTINSGTVNVRGANGATTATVNGGVVTFEASSTGMTTLNCYGGTTYIDIGSTVGTLVVGDGAAVEFRSPGGATVTNCTLQAGATLRDRGKLTTFTNGFDFDQCGVEDLAAFEVGDNYTLTLSAI